MPTKSYDITGKDIIESYPDAVPALLGSWSYHGVEVIDADISTVTGATDKAILVHGDQGDWILSTEVQVSHKLDIPGRLQVESVLLSRRHGLPVHSAVILLRRDANASNLTGELGSCMPGESDPYLRFRYQVMRLWEQPLERLLQGSLGLLPLATLTDEAALALPEVIKRVESRIRREADSTERALLRMRTFILLGLRYSRELIEQLDLGETTMEESVTYQLILEKGAKGGEERGRLSATRENLLDLAQSRYGNPNDATLAAIAAIDDLKTLKKLLIRTSVATSWDELLA